MVTWSTETAPKSIANSSTGAVPLATLATRPAEAKESFCRRLKVPTGFRMEKVLPAVRFKVAPAVPGPVVPAITPATPGLAARVAPLLTVMAVFASEAPEASSSVPAVTVVAPV